jgi:hypothetical protein
MNEDVGMLAKFGLAAGTARLIQRRRESRMQRFFHRLAFNVRGTWQLWMPTRRARRRAFPMTLLPVTSTMSLPTLSLGSMSFPPGRHGTMFAQRDGRMMTMVMMAPKTGLARVTDTAREHRGLSLLALGALAAAGLAVLGWQIRSRSSAPTMLGDGQDAGYWQGGGSAPSATQVLEHPNTEARTQSGTWSAMESSSSTPSNATSAMHQDWADMAHDFSEPNLNRPVKVEVQEAGGNTRPLAHGLPLLGIDVGRDGVQIMLGESIDNRMEHDISDPVGMQPISGEDGRQVGLSIQAGDGSTTMLTLA